MKQRIFSLWTLLASAAEIYSDTDAGSVGHDFPLWAPPMELKKLGPYLIGRQIGRGGMGEVYEATHEETRQRVAVKVLSPAMARSEGFRERFESEIESLRQLRHPNIVEMIGYGEHEGLLFYSMERIEGRSLEDELASERRFDWREVTAIGIQLCRALKHAHDHGVIHRDLKPANILLTAKDEVKLLDFGIARLFGGNQMTNAGGVLGTADYMSPEQADGRPVTDRCDQYSLGCVLYALATGGPPFHSTSLPKLLQMQRFAQPEPLRRYAPDAPEELERIVLQLLEKDPERRFPNVSVLQRQLSAMQRALTRPAEQDDFQVQQTEAAEFEPPVQESLAPTRVIKEGESSEAVRSDVTQDLPHAPAAPQSAPTQVTPPPAAPPAREPAPTSRFTSVEEELARERRQQADSWWTVAARLLLLVGALGLLAAGAWYLMRPRSADELYAQIQQAAANAGPENLRQVEAEISEFLTRFPNDPRQAEIAAYHEQLELQRAERRLRLVARLAGAGAELSPLERTYVEAIRQADSHPEQAIAQLAALTALHEEQEDLTRAQQQCLALARRQLARLRVEVGRRAEEHLAMLDDRLARAEQLRATEPEQAARIWRAIVELYADKPWARDAVQQAREGLGTRDEEARSTSRSRIRQNLGATKKRTKFWRIRLRKSQSLGVCLLLFHLL